MDSCEQFKQLFNSALGAILVIDKESGIILDASDAACELLMMSKECLVGAHENHIFSPSKIESTFSPLFEIFKQAQSSIIRKVTISPNALRTLDLEVKGTSQKWMGNDAVILLLQDISTLIQVETHEQNFMSNEDMWKRELQKTTRLASLGILSSGIAHEINNPLTIIGGNASLLKETLKKNLTPLDERAFEDIRENVKRIAQIIDALRSYNKNATLERGEHHLHSIVQDTLQVVSPLLKQQRINLIENFSAENDHLYCVRHDIQELILSFLTNAKEALISNRVDPEILISTESTSEELTLKISDNGTGITKEDLPHIFDPFFTTRRSDSKKGLGLFLVHNIVGQHQGKIQVESEEKKRTTFTVVLPLIQKNEN